MAAPVVKLKRSSVPGKIPLTTDIDLGEIAINTFDGKAYFKKDNGTESIVEIGTGAGGGGGGSYTAPAILTLYNKNNSGGPATFDGTETRFQLRDSPGDIVTVSSALLAAISVDGVIQKPNSGIPVGSFEGFYVTTNATLGYDIVFGSAPSSTSTFFGVLSGTFAATSGTTGITKLDSLTSQFNGTATSFTLKVNNVAYAPEYANAVLIIVGGVVQIPTSAYTISGSTIAFTSAPPTGTSFYGIDFKIGDSGGSASLITENKIVIDQNVTIGVGYNGLSAGPIEVAATYSVEVPSGGTWVIL